MSCREVAPLLNDYLDGGLEASPAGRVEAHLAACPACAGDLRELRGAVGLLRSLPDPTPSEGFRDALRARLAAQRGSARRRRVWLRASLVAGAGAAAAAALFVAVAPPGERGGAVARTGDPPAAVASAPLAPSPASFRGLAPPTRAEDLDRELDTALGRPGEFAERLGGLAEGDRERWLGALARRAFERGDAAGIARRLREADAPLARPLAAAFEAAPER